MISEPFPRNALVRIFWTKERRGERRPALVVNLLFGIAWALIGLIKMILVAGCVFRRWVGQPSTGEFSTERMGRALILNVKFSANTITGIYHIAFFDSPAGGWPYLGATLAPRHEFRIMGGA